MNSKIDHETNQLTGHILISLHDQVELEKIEHEYIELCQQLDIHGCIKATDSNLLNKKE